MIETSPSAPYLILLLWTLAELKLWGPVEPVEKKIWSFEKYFLKNKESIKKMVHDSEFGWGRYDRNKPKCSVFEPAPMNLGWTETLGTSLPSFSMMWTTRELAMTVLQNEPHTRTTLDHRWTYTRLKNRSSPKRWP